MRYRACLESVDGDPEQVEGALLRRGRLRHAMLLAQPACARSSPCRGNHLLQPSGAHIVDIPGHRDLARDER